MGTKIETKAPITTISNVAGKKNNQVKIPVKIKDFKGIQAITLRIDYKKSDLTFVRLEPAKSFYDNPMWAATEVNETTMKLKFVWTSLKPYSLKNGMVLFYIVFKYKGNETDLVWNPLNGDCEYADYRAVALDDNPKSDYYINGKVSTK